MLAIAASFWSQHGYTPGPITWDWGIPSYVRVEPGAIAEGFSVFGSNHIFLNRSWWDHAENWRKCEVVIHEEGHAAFSFRHQDGTVMSEIDDVYGGIRTVPGTCKRWKVKP